MNDNTTLTLKPIINYKVHNSRELFTLNDKLQKTPEKKLNCFQPNCFEHLIEDYSLKDFSAFLKAPKLVNNFLRIAFIFFDKLKLCVAVL